MYGTILVALDGSAESAAGGRLALAAARHLGAELVACHAYAARLHTDRFRAMEPGLPQQYQGRDALAGLRDAHGSLIREGMEALSQGYLEGFLAEARGAGVPAAERHLEGRSHLRILETAAECGADLIVLGARGLGALGDGLLGSTACRVLRQAACDVLVARRAPAGGGVLAGIDGSREALAAVRKACLWRRALGGPLRIAAAYDPQLHKQVFEAMARSLTPERQEQVGLEKQEELHKELIDDGLGALYRCFLDAALERARALGTEAEGALLQGKAYAALAAAGSGADLLAVGRFGHHREGAVDIGSNAEALVRTASTNLLVTAPPAPAAQAPERAGEAAMEWDADALERLGRIPAFARPMARRGVEARVRAQGGARVTLQDFLAVGRSMGMGGPEREG